MHILEKIMFVLLAATMASEVITADEPSDGSVK